MQNHGTKQWKERCQLLEAENHFYNEELISTQQALSQTQAALQASRTLYQQLQADFENVINHLQGIRKPL